MPYYYDMLSSSDDEDIIDFINRRLKKFKTRHNYFEELDDIEFKIRFRMGKQSVMWLCNEIEEDLKFPSNKNWPLSPLNQLLLTLRLFATRSHYMPVADFSDMQQNNGIMNHTYAQGTQLNVYLEFGREDSLLWC
ncbi:uncharacterized protein LOC107274471 isoform X1 [Cephus cinctus]|uniref:Uncharacterized protein LOC107274471 isoform X1 n=1 Tax=Cephus cinctus TaxID=211228 RepID=A0AAJ7RVS6_CEPCN|nr:uncharacterized protein LOC107274471 isoform X1 [Cephus cinctus]